MPDHNKRISGKQAIKAAQEQDVEVFKAEFLVRENELNKKKVEIGYGSLSESDFLLLHPDVEKGQVTASEMLKLQEDYRRLRDEEQLLFAEDLVVEELNKKHAVVHTDQFYILTEKPNPIFGGVDFTLESKQSFKNLYENKQIRFANGIRKSKADIWLKSPIRREYKGIVFEPNDGAQFSGYYNIWKGFAKQSQMGDCSKYWAHVRDNICSKNTVSYVFVRKIIACIFQNPDEVHIALLLLGSQGVGKNSFVEPLGVLLGSHYVLLSSIHELTSHFNYHLKNAVLIHANEAMWGGNKKEIGTLKGMITEKTICIEGKGKDQVMVKNFRHLILSSNEEWPVHLDRDDRRFYVLRVSEERKEDHAYFAAIEEDLKNGGYEALLYDLLHEDLTGFNPRRFPNSEDAFDIKLQSADSIDQYVYAALKEGCFDIGNGTPDLVWNSKCKTSVFNDYDSWCIRNRSTSAGTAKFAKRLKKLIPSIKEYRPGVGQDPSRQRRYEVPSLEQARKEFAQAYKAGDSIWDD